MYVPEKAPHREVRSEPKVVPRFGVMQRRSSFTSGAFCCLFCRSFAPRWFAVKSAVGKGENPVAICPECNGSVLLDGVERGEIVPCPDCGAELEVRDLEPLTLTLAPEMQEDWGE